MSILLHSLFDDCDYYFPEFDHMVGFRSLSKSIYNDFNCSVCLNTLPSWGSLEGECGWLVKWFQTSHVGEVVFRIFYTIWNFSGWKTGGNKIFSSRSSQPIILWVFFPTEAKQDVLWSLGITLEDFWIYSLMHLPLTSIPPQSFFQL